MKPAIFATLLTLVLVALPAHGQMSLVEVNEINYQGEDAYEYIYDIHGLPGHFSMEGFDAAGLLNLYDDGLGPQLFDTWTGWAAGYESGFAIGGGLRGGPFPSYGEGDVDDVWTTSPSQAAQDDNGWAYDASYAATNARINTWHAPSEYVMSFGSLWRPGQVVSVATGGDYDGLAIDWVILFGGGTTELTMTLRLIHPDGPYSTFTYNSEATGDSHSVVGPGVPEPATMSLLAVGGLAVLRRRRK